MGLPTVLDIQNSIQSLNGKRDRVYASLVYKVKCLIRDVRDGHARTSFTLENVSGLILDTPAFSDDIASIAREFGVVASVIFSNDGSVRITIAPTVDDLT